MGALSRIQARIPSRVVPETADCEVPGGIPSAGGSSTVYGGGAAAEDSVMISTCE